MAENISPAGVNRIVRELKQLKKEPIEGITVEVSEDNLCEINATIAGPENTPYEGGNFKMKLVLGPDFPGSPPKGFFLTKIFHPNVSENGDICVNVLKKDWTPSLGVRHVLMVIRCLLIEPYPESALNEEAGKLLLEDYEGYAKHAKLMTSIHASASREKKDIDKSGGVKKVIAKDKAEKKKVADKKKSLRRL